MGALHCISKFIDKVVNMPIEESGDIPAIHFLYKQDFIDNTTATLLFLHMSLPLAYSMLVKTIIFINTI